MEKRIRVRRIRRGEKRRLSRFTGGSRIDELRAKAGCAECANGTRMILIRREKECWVANSPRCLPSEERASLISLSLSGVGAVCGARYSESLLERTARVLKFAAGLLSCQAMEGMGVASAFGAAAALRATSAASAANGIFSLDAMQDSDSYMIAAPEPPEALLSVAAAACVFARDAIGIPLVSGECGETGVEASDFSICVVLESLRRPRRARVESRYRPTPVSTIRRRRRERKTRRRATSTPATPRRSLSRSLLSARARARARERPLS